MDLTALSQAARKLIIFLAIGIVVWIIVLLVFNLTLRIIKNLTPAKPPAADQLFGSLKEIKFKQPTLSSAKFSYTLETVDSKPPTMPTIENVYRLLTPTAHFLSLDQAKNQAKVFGFNEEPQAVSKQLYQWVDTDLPGYTLTMDIIKGDVHLRADTAKIASQLSSSLHIDSTEAVSHARNYLKNRLPIPTLFDNGDTKVQFLNVTSTQIKRVSSADQANSFRVDIYPGKLADNSVILTQTPEESMLNVTLFTGKEGGDFPLEINYQQFVVDTDSKATYDIKTSASAWQELLNGKGIVIKTPTQSGGIAIQSITLGYFFEEGSAYLQPIYIFEGVSSADTANTDFTAILPAIASPNKSQ